MLSIIVKSCVSSGRRVTAASIQAAPVAFESILSTTCHGTTSSPLSNELGQVRSYRSNRSRRGLYNGKDIRSGNHVSFSMHKTKRKFKPNAFKKRLYSEILDEMIQFHVTASTLRTVDHVGGLDNYLLNSKHIKEGEGLEAKKRILQKQWEMKSELSEGQEGE